jgi:enoyl-CoA hydratase/carnithine racemase
MEANDGVEQEYGLVVVTRLGAVALVELNVPERLNALSPKTMEADLSHALADLGADLETRAVVLTGRGRSFCSGAMMAGGPVEPRDPRDVERTGAQRMAWGYSFGDFWKNINGFKKPLIAAVNGYALGGGWKLAFVCDMIVAGESAVIGSAEMKVGLTPSPLTGSYLPKMLGKHRAFETFLFSKRYTAAEAYELGLVNRVVPDAELVPTALAIAEEIAAMPAVAVAFTKQVMQRAFGMDDDYDYARALASYLGSVDETQAAGMAARAAMQH